MGEELEGFDESVLNEHNLEKQGLKNKIMEQQQAMIGSNFSDAEEPTLIHYQLETEKILGRIEHFLKGDQVSINENGDVVYIVPKKNVICKVVKDKDGIEYTIDIDTKKIWLMKDAKKDASFGEEDATLISGGLGDGTTILQMKKLKFIRLKKIEIIDEALINFNKYGVTELMRIISMYVTKETFLSNYEEDRINEIMADLGDAIAGFMYCGYEKMGMDTKYKETKFTLIVLNILHTIESCYRRALNGEEMKGLRSRAIVTQNNAMGNPNMGGGVPNLRKKWHPLKKDTW